MEIEFNPSRKLEAGESSTVRRQAAAAPAGETVSFERTRALEQRLKELPASRPEQVERARNLVADVKYPPAEMLDRIANLLALHVRR